MSQQDKRIVAVTGAAGGIGRAIARRLAQNGAHVIVIDVSDGSETVEAIETDGGSAEFRPGDVTDPSAMDAAFNDLTLDTLVNNAACYAPLVDEKKRFDAIDESEWDSVMAVNVKGVFLASRAALPQFDGGGRIINIASTTALKGTSGFLHYVASKAAVLGMTRAMATELGDIGIRVNALAPGFTTSKASMQAGEEYLDARVEGQAIQRPVRPDDIANAVSFLADPESEMITGHVLTVDGGKTMH